MADEKRGGVLAVEQVTRSLRLSPRVFYPGAAVALFLYWRYGIDPFASPVRQGFPSLLFALLTGALIYYAYRGVFHPLIWLIQRETTIGVLQRRLHDAVAREVVDELCQNPSYVGPPSRSMLFSQACLDTFQKQLEERERAETAAFNSGSHLLYLTAAIALVFVVHDVATMKVGCSGSDTTAVANVSTRSTEKVGAGNAATESATPLPHRCPRVPELAAWFTLMLVGLGGGLAYDRNADYREALQLYKHRDRYRDVVRSALKEWDQTGRPAFSIGRYWCRTGWFWAVTIVLMVWVTAVGVSAWQPRPPHLSSFLAFPLGWVVALVVGVILVTVKYARSTPVPVEDTADFRRAIRLRAYELFLKRCANGQAGSAEDDWRQAELVLNERIPPQRT